jgi:hypothetical protein
MKNPILTNKKKDRKRMQKDFTKLFFQWYMMMLEFNLEFAVDVMILVPADF